MKIQRKRCLSAWLLLAIYMPMLSLTLVHHHGEVDLKDVSCTDCTQNIRHNGHFSTGIISLDDCPICQFSSTTYTLTDNAAVQQVEVRSDELVATTVQPLQIGVILTHSSRAPPAFA